MALHINLYGGPSAGKSTMRARLFYELKKLQYKVEEIPEIAKDLTYSEDFVSLSDQVLMLGRQHHKHLVLDNLVDYVITDSPFVMGSTYIQDNCPYKEELVNLMLKMDESYSSINFFIERNHKYQEYGRVQTLEEANQKADDIKNFLNESEIAYVCLPSGEEFIEEAIKIIKGIQNG